MFLFFLNKISNFYSLLATMFLGTAWTKHISWQIPRLLHTNIGQNNVNQFNISLQKESFSISFPFITMYTPKLIAPCVHWQIAETDIVKNCFVLLCYQQCDGWKNCINKGCLKNFRLDMGYVYGNRIIKTFGIATLGRVCSPTKKVIIIPLSLYTYFRLK